MHLFISNSNNIGNISSLVCARKAKSAQSRSCIYLKYCLQAKHKQAAPVHLQVGDASALEFRQGCGWWFIAEAMPLDLPELGNTVTAAMLAHINLSNQFSLTVPPLILKAKEQHKAFSAKSQPSRLVCHSTKQWNQQEEIRQTLLKLNIGSRYSVPFLHCHSKEKQMNFRYTNGQPHVQRW